MSSVLTATTVKAIGGRGVIRRRPLLDGAPDPKGRVVLGCGYLLFVASWLSLLGPIAPLMMMGATLGILALAPMTVFQALLRCWPILIVAGLAPLSALWSTDPSISLRYGVQLAITLGAAVALASVTGPRAFLRIVFLGSLFVLALCILSGRQGGSPQGPVLIGVLGSKNEMGQLCQLAICSAIMTALSRGEARWLRLLAVPAAAFAGLVLAYTFATGAVLTTLAFLLAAAVFALGSRLPTGSKFLLAGLLLLFAVPLWLIQADIVRFYEWFVVNVLGKDIGLTGRDYLWAHADRMIGDRPALGHGYRSTWLGSGPDTIGLLRWAGLSSGAGFNFHDTYREWMVDFGIAGAVVVLLGLGAGMIRLIGVSLSRRATTAIVFAAASVVVLAARAKVETIYGPFGSSGLLIGVTAAFGYLSAGSGRPVPAPGRGSQTVVRRRQAAVRQRAAAARSSRA